jgi:CheY-like chemotaxis protein
MKNKIPSILIIDDQVDFLLMLKHMLDNIGFTNIQYQKNAYQALKEYELFDIIFLDLKMPGMSGLEFLKNIKSTHNINKFLPKIIIITSDSDPVTKYECLQNGADEYIIKPANKDAIINGLKKINAII